MTRDDVVRGILCPKCHQVINRMAQFRRGRGMTPSKFFYCPSCNLVCDVDGHISDMKFEVE